MSFALTSGGLRVEVFWQRLRVHKYTRERLFGSYGGLLTMIKQAGTAGYVSISGRKIGAIVLILICSFALAWATRSGKGNKSDISVKPAQPLMAHTNQARMGGRSVSPATHNHSTAAGKTHTHHRQGALSNFKPHSTPSSGARHSKGGAGQGANSGAGQGANSGAGQGANSGAGQGANQGAGQGANQGAGHNAKSDTTPSPTPGENLNPTSDTILGSSATITGTSRWPRAAATPAPSPP